MIRIRFFVLAPSAAAVRIASRSAGKACTPSTNRPRTASTGPRVMPVSMPRLIPSTRPRPMPPIASGTSTRIACSDRDSTSRPRLSVPIGKASDGAWFWLARLSSFGLVESRTPAKIPATTTRMTISRPRRRRPGSDPIPAATDLTGRRARTRIEDAVEDVDDEEDEDVDQRREEHRSDDHVEVVHGEPVHRVEADPGPPEHLLDQEVAGDQVSADDSDRRHDRGQCDREDASEVEVEAAVPVRAGCEHEVGAEDAPHRRPGDAGDRRGGDDRERARRQHEMREGAPDDVPPPVEDPVDDVEAGRAVGGRDRGGEPPDRRRTTEKCT